MQERETKRVIDWGRIIFCVLFGMAFILSVMLIGYLIVTFTNFFQSSGGIYKDMIFAGLFGVLCISVLFKIVDLVSILFIEFFTIEVEE